MSYLGKAVRLNRLFRNPSGRVLFIALDHAIGWGVLPGIENIQETVDKMVAAGADALTLLPGTAAYTLEKHAGRIPFILKCTTFSPCHPTFDARIAGVEEAIRLGADAVSIGATLGSERQEQLLTQLAEFVRAANSFGMPTVTHIYPRGARIPEQERYSSKWVSYAARAAAELGVDIVKTYYTGDPVSYGKVIAACPAKVVVSGGPKLPTVEDLLRMTKDAVDAGAAGVTYGRNVWQAEDPVNTVKALAHIIHHDGAVDEAVEILRG